MNVVGSIHLCFVDGTPDAVKAACPVWSGGKGRDYIKALPIAIVATIRKYEISVAIIVQSLQQMKNLYKDDWETLTGNCDNTVYLGGGADTVSTEWISKLLGKETRVVMNINYSKNGGGQSLNRTGVELYTPSQLRTLPKDKCLIIPSRMDAFLGKKYPAKKHPNWKEMVALNKEKGAYIFDQHKAEILHAEKSRQEDVIIDQHGDVQDMDATVALAQNQKEEQLAEENGKNFDSFENRPLISPQTKIGKRGEGLEETVPIKTNADSSSAIEASIDANDAMWGPDEFLYGEAGANIA